MALVSLFRALHPTPESAGRVAAVPYDVIDIDEARALAAHEPLSFLHVSRAEIDLPPATDPYSPVVYETAAARFAALKREAPLVRDEEPSLYLYGLRMDGHQQIGVAAGYSLDEYDADLIKKHERTRQDKEDDRMRHLVALRAQTGPVFLVHRSLPAIDKAVASLTAETPLFDFTAPDAVRHTIWRVVGRAADTLVTAFSRVQALYIADGHHRAASAARARRALGGVSSAAATFLAVAFPENQVRILPYHRVVKDLGSLSAAAFLSAVKGRVRVEEGSAVPDRKGIVSMYLAGRWYALHLAAGDWAGADVLGTLDVSLLQDQIFAPILGIADPRTDQRIDFVGGVRGTRELEKKIDAGQAQVAFSLLPISLAELMSVADAGQILPPKSTWFEPKLRDGLLVHLI